MIAVAGYYRWKKQGMKPVRFEVEPKLRVNLPLTPSYEEGGN